MNLILFIIGCITLDLNVELKANFFVIWVKFSELFEVNFLLEVRKLSIC